MSSLSLVKRKLLGHQDRDHLVAVPAINFKLRKPNQTGIRKGHRPVPIAAHEDSQVRVLLLDIERGANDSALQQSEQGIGVAAFALQERCSLGKNRFAGEQRWAKRFPLFATPGMVLQPGAKETYQRAGIEKPRPFFHCPKPSMYFGLSARSFGSPLILPARSRDRS